MQKFAALGVIILVWGFYYLGIDIALRSGWDPHLLNATRFFLATLILLAVLGLRGQLGETVRIQREKSWQLLLVALFGVALGVGLLTLGQERASSGVSGVVASTTSLWTAALGLLLFFGREKLHASAWIGVLLGILGVVFLYAPWSEASSSSVGILLLLLGAIFLALEAQLILKWLADLPLLPVATLIVFWSGVCFAVAALLWGSWSTGNLWSMLFTAAGTVAFAYTLYIWLIKEAGPTFANTYAFFLPAVALLAGWLFNAEKITGLITLGSLFCLAGAILVARGASLKKSA